MEVGSVLLIGLGIKFFMALASVFAVISAIYMMDRIFKINVKGWLNEAGPVAQAIYFGARFIGLCLLFAAIMG